MFGGQYVPRKIDRSRSIQGASIGILPPPPSENSIVPWSNDITMTGDDVEDNDDSEEPDPKRLRLTDGYDIALAVMEVPRTYNEAMASPQAYKWKEAIHDLLVGCADDATDDDIKAQLSEHFKLKDLGHARFVLGIEIQYDRPKAKLHICQSQLILRLIEKFGQ
ncbi:hypothetical protein PsorP6_016342 [Peronosclerospora sorghi]|uniref:Uncharacterized protein n=1 Tax=Peronosclerospora sorghi TaxID=230839 RepID=A0ACC0VL40_9STRA|nr:hypothetical protein PsorP6_016342 [Peronosclerospora sorghi]